MKKSVVLLGAVLWIATGVSFAQVVLEDGFEGPWYLPENTFSINSGGGGFDEDWFVDHVDWVGDAQFNLDYDDTIKTEGNYAQKANSAVNDGNIRDLYLARLVTGIRGGTTYSIAIDYRFDKLDQNNHIQYTVRDGDNQTREDIGDIEQYTGHDRPNTRKVDATTFGDGAFHTLTTAYTPAEGVESFTFMMIVRFWSSDLESNWLWLDRFVVSVEEMTDVSNWDLFE